MILRDMNITKITYITTIDIGNGSPSNIYDTTIMMLHMWEYSSTLVLFNIIIVIVKGHRHDLHQLLLSLSILQYCNFII